MATRRETPVITALSDTKKFTATDMDHLEAEKKKLIECLLAEFAGVGNTGPITKKSNCYEIVMIYDNQVSDSKRQNIRNQFNQVSIRSEGSRDYFNLAFHKADSCQLKEEIDRYILNNRTWLGSVIVKLLKGIIIAALFYVFWLLNDYVSGSSEL